MFRLKNLLQEILLSLEKFQQSEFVHIYRELNVKADELSKEALQMQVGTFYFLEFVDMEEVDAMAFHFHS